MLARRAPDGVRIYAIGDVHGRLDLLEMLLQLIDADRASHPGREHIEISLGDLIDRGPDSMGVIERVMRRQASHGLSVVRGNHDQYLLDAVDDPASIDHWLAWGGVEALASWGVEARPGRAPDRDMLLRAVGPAQLAFVRAMPLMQRHGDLVFVHAGIRPGVPLEAQEPRDLMMIREPFLSDRRDHGVIVVHGHTPGSAPVVRANRIGVDTGAFNSGVLTAAVFDGDHLSFITTDGPRGSWGQ